TATWPSTAATAPRASSGTDEVDEPAFRAPTASRNGPGSHGNVGSLGVRRPRRDRGTGAARRHGRGGSRVTQPLTDPGIGPGAWEPADAVRGGRADPALPGGC